MFFLWHLQAEISDPTVAAPTHDQFLSEMCDGYLPALVTSCHLLVYTFTTECDRRHGYTTARRRAYTDSLSQQVYADLVSFIGSSSSLGSGGVFQNVGSLTGEWADQEHLCGILSGFYDIIQAQEEKVRGDVRFSDYVFELFCWTFSLDLNLHGFRSELMCSRRINSAH